MIISNIPSLSSMSTVKAKVDLFNGSTLVKTCTCGDVLSDFTVTREGENGKFFGFGICHKLNIHFIDINRELTVTEGNTAEIGLGDGGNIWDAPYPTFYITEIERDEKSNTITGTAYDRLYWAGSYTLGDLNLTAPYTLQQVAQAVADKLGLSLRISVFLYSAFRLAYQDGANFGEDDADKDLRVVLNWLAEATQSVYFVNHNNELIFQRLDIDDEAVEHITKNEYYSLNTKTTKTLTAICNVTELGDNLEASTGEEGVTQYIRNNPFLELREDLADILDSAIEEMGGTPITQFDCAWVGNYLLEIGDKIALETEDGEEVYAFLLSDTATYAGTYDETTSWEYVDQASDTSSNPTSIGEKINQTYAKVDKVNKRIELLVTDVDEAKETVASLALTTEAINLKVTEHEEKIEAFQELETGQIVDRMAQIEIDLNSIEATVSSNTTQIQTTKDEVAGVKQTTNNNATRLSAIEANLDGINLTVSNQNSKITTVEATTKAQSDKIAGLEATTNSQNTALNNLSDAVDENADDIAAVTKTTEEQATKISKIEIDLSSIDLTVKNQTTQITTLETTTKNQGTAIAGLSSDVEENASAIGTLTETTNTQASQIGQLQVEANNIKASVSANTSQINTVKDSVSEIETTTETHTNQISALQLGATEISATVSNITETSRVSTENIELQIEQLTQEVSTKVTAEDLNITVRNAVSNGVEKVETTTGFTFDETGLTIEKSGREMKTQITEDGMKVFRDTTAVLTADNQGVDAKNLKASTYLVIGTNSRFENYGTTRTACFWIGD